MRSESVIVGKEADVVVVGYGGAGAAITAHDMGAEVLILEKCAEGGGNTRLAVSSFTGVVPGDRARKHLKALFVGESKTTLSMYTLSGLLKMQISSAILAVNRYHMFLGLHFLR